MKEAEQDPEACDFASVPVEAEPISCEQWMAQADRWKSKGFFQTPQWVEILCEAFAEFENSSVVLHGPDGAKVLLPLVKNRKAPGLYTWLSLPYGTYGGPLRYIEDESYHWPLVQSFLSNNLFTAFNLTLPPGNEAPSWEGFAVKELTTQVLDLREGFEDVVEHRFTPACRRAIRKAQRNKVEIRPLEAGKYLGRFLQLYDQSMNRWGLSKGFPARLFELLWSAPGVKYWGALHQGQLVSAALIVSHGTHQYYWLGVMDEAANEVRPNNLLFHEILEDSCRNGIETFDLGNSEGLIGVFNFKKSFGPSVETYPLLHRAGTLIRGLRRLRSFLRG